MNIRHLLVVLSAMSFSFQSLWAGDKVFYVSPKGNDKNAGCLNKPLKTIRMALQKAGEVNEGEPVEIILRGGCYEQDQTIEINKRGNLVIKPYLDEKVVVSGGRKLSSRALKNISDPSVLAKLQPQVRKLVKEIDFAKLGLALNDLHASGFGRPSQPAWTQVFVNEEALALSRWATMTLRCILARSSNRG